MDIFFELDGLGVKKSCYLRKNVFVIYSPKAVTIDPANSIKLDTVILHLPEKAEAYVTSKFKGHEIFKIDKKKSRLWIEILNESYFDELKIKIKTPIGFPVIKPENSKFAYGREKKPKKAVGGPKNWEKS